MEINSAPNAKSETGRILSPKEKLELPKGVYLQGQKPPKKVTVQEFHKEEKGKIGMESENQKEVSMPNQADQTMLKLAKRK